MSDGMLKIKLSVADRLYPLTIRPDQEEGLRSACKRIEESIKQLESSYAVRDKQDVLAMCALQFAASVEQRGLDLKQHMQEAELRLRNLDAELAKWINKE